MPEKEETLVEFFRIDIGKTLITGIILIIGFIITLFYIWIITSEKPIISLNPFILMSISFISPIFAMGISYFYVYQNIPIILLIMISLGSIFQFIYWYSLACAFVYLKKRYFKKEDRFA